MRAVLERDFLSTAIRGRAFFLRALVPAATAAVAFLVYDDCRHMFQSRPDEAARLVFAGAGCALLAMLALLTPPSVVGSILEERQRQTLSLVLASPVRPTAFAAAKLLSRSLAVLSWGLAALFPVTLTLLLGGVAQGQVLDLALLAVAVVLELAAWSLWISSFTHRLATAAVLAYLLPFARWTLTALLAAYAAGPDPQLRVLAPSVEAKTAWWVLGATTPVPGCGRMLDPAGYDSVLFQSFGGYGAWRGARGVAYIYSSGGRWTTVPGLSRSPAPPRPAVSPLLVHPSLVYLVFSLLAALGAAWAAGRRLATESEPRSSAFQRWLRGRRGGRSPPGDGNPMAWKERRLLNTAASRPLYYSVFGLMVAGELALLVAFGMVPGTNRDYMQSALAFAAAHATLLGLVAVVAGAACMAYERSVGTLELLRGTLLGPGEIVRGKLGGLLRGLLLIGLLPVCHVAVMVAAGFMDPVTGGLALFADVVFAVFWALAGMLSGLTVLRMGAAVTRGALLYGATLIGFPLVAVVAEAGFRDRGTSELFLGGCPPVTVHQCLEVSLRAFHGPWWDVHWGSVRSGGSLHGLQQSAVGWFVGYAFVAWLFFVISPFALARRFEREREVG